MISISGNISLEWWVYSYTGLLLPKMDGSFFFWKHLLSACCIDNIAARMSWLFGQCDWLWMKLLHQYFFRGGSLKDGSFIASEILQLAESLRILIRMRSWSYSGHFSSIWSVELILGIESYLQEGYAIDNSFHVMVTYLNQEYTIDTL